MSKRGISPLIATVLIIGFTVALAAVIMLWGTDFLKGMQEKTELSAEKSQTCAAAILELGDVEQTDVGKLSFLLENVGQVDVKGLIIRIIGDGGAVSLSLPGLRSSEKRAYADVEFEPVGIVTKVNIIPNLDIRSKSVPCTPGIELEAETSDGKVQEIEAKLEECGNGAVDTWEECDGADLAGRTCLTEGFSGGALGCYENCWFDMNGCEGADECGNEGLDAVEECDLDAWGGVLPETETCATQGFAGGGLKCRNCRFDTSGCSSGPVCGNNVIEGVEECDGVELGGETCADYGHTAGSLVCNADCTIDSSDCSTCGNGVQEGSEQRDGSDFAPGGYFCEEPSTRGCAADCTFTCIFP